MHPVFILYIMSCFTTHHPANFGTEGASTDRPMQHCSWEKSSHTPFTGQKECENFAMAQFERNKFNSWSDDSSTYTPTLTSWRCARSE